MPTAFQLLKRWIEIADASCAPRGIRFRAKVTAVECLCVQMKEYFFPRPKPSLSQAAQSVSEILIMPNLEFDCNAVKRERERERNKKCACNLFLGRLQTLFLSCTSERDGFKNFVSKIVSWRDSLNLNYFPN